MNKEEYRDSMYYRKYGCCKRILPVRYRGQKFIVTCKDYDEKEMTVGYTNKSGGTALFNTVNMHPEWHSPRIERMPKEIIRNASN